MTRKKGKHLTETDRYTIERMLNNGFSIKEIALAIGCCIRTVYYEIKRATYVHTNYDYTTEIRYAPEVAHERYRENLKKKGRKPKILSDDNIKTYIKTMIVKYDYSPEAILYTIKNDNLRFESEIKSVNTIYDAIKRGYIEGVTLNCLPRLRDKKRRKKRISKQKSAPVGTSIELRDESVLERNSFGDWEMDCVIGTQTNKKTLLVLTERKTRFEIIELLKRHTTKEVVRALNRIEKRFGAAFYKIFKSITVDNGAEFKDFNGMEKALYRKGIRTKIFYCHPYSSYERGSNENNNHLVRRFFPKGSDFDKTITRAKVKEAEEWINFYPRRLFNGKSAFEIYTEELYMIGCQAYS